MSTANENARDAWQRIANALSKQRPYQGRTIEVIRGIKHVGKRGTVIRHQTDQYSDAFRDGGARSLTRLAGRDGYVVKVMPSGGGSVFWVKALYVLCVDGNATCDECGETHLADCEAIARLAEAVHGTDMEACLEEDGPTGGWG